MLGEETYAQHNIQIATGWTIKYFKFQEFSEKSSNQNPQFQKRKKKILRTVLVSSSVFFQVCDQLLTALDPQAKTMWSAMLFSQFPVVFRCFIIIVKLHNGKQAKLPGSLQTSSIPFSMQNELIGSRGQFLIWCRTYFPCCENKLALTHMSF